MLHLQNFTVVVSPIKVGVSAMILIKYQEEILTLVREGGCDTVSHPVLNPLKISNLGNTSKLGEGV